MKKFSIGASVIFLFVLVAVIGEVATSGATPSPTATSVLSSASQFITPSPTATLAPIPTDTPTQALSVQQKIANAIAADGSAVSFCLIVNAATTPVVAIAGQAVTITSDTSSEPGFINDDRAENCIFYLEQDAWASDPSATQVTVHVQILLQDQYGKQSTGDTAWAILKQATERQFVWANLSYTQAWADYDETWLLPGNV